MKKLVLALLACGCAFGVAQTAQAEEVHTMKEVVVRGRVDRPHVVIEIARPTAARSAGAAHDDMKARLVARTAPQPPRP